ncbi:MAG: hypothetical protein MZV63_62975 [Marinilabiliales bacterium]|nr:hypothetical protein [Marinilabiliales bacterium]
MLVPAAQPDLRPPGVWRARPPPGPGRSPCSEARGARPPGRGSRGPGRNRPARRGPTRCGKGAPGVVGVELEGPPGVPQAGVAIRRATRLGPARPAQRVGRARLELRAPAGRSARRRRASLRQQSAAGP